MEKNSSKQQYPAAILSRDPDRAQEYLAILKSCHFRPVIIPVESASQEIWSRYDLYIVDNHHGDFPYGTILDEFNPGASHCFMVNIGDEPPEELQALTMVCSLNSIPDEKYLVKLLSMIHELLEREAVQTEFSSLLLHDIRSPLNSMIGYMELLINGTFGKMEDTHLPILEKAIEMGDTALDMMEELAEVFKHEQNSYTVNKQFFNLNHLVESVLSIIWVKADQNNIQIKKIIHENITRIYGDEYQILRLLTNLLTNAINHVPPNTTIYLDVQPSSNQIVKFEVRDNGNGVPEQDLSHLFDKYYRYNTHPKAAKGHGLGLYICKIIAQAHGGKIWAENNETGGLSVKFTLPHPVETN